jgi:hypothetical protein
MTPQNNQKQRDFGWRIEKTPYQDSKVRGVVSFIPALGALGFMVGFALIFLILFLRVHSLATFYNAALVLTGSGFVVMWTGFWLMARKKRAGWKIVEGRCIDREVKEVPGLDGLTWMWRVVCEYELDGSKYRVTPMMGWTSYASEKAALEYLAKRISPDGRCKLGVNPKVPLQTELLEGRGIEDLLLWKAHKPSSPYRAD